MPPRAKIDAVDDSEHPDSTAQLRSAWRRHVAADDRPLTALFVRHRERHRRYHTLGHVAAVVGHAEELDAAEPVDDVAAVVAAAMYHDAVYEPRSPANERASARLAGTDLRALGWADTRVDHVIAMIDGTRTHLDPPDADSAVLFDADLAILGADPDVYDRYVTDVRSEYGHVADTDWLIGRAEVLGSLLRRGSIFATDAGRTRWEARARANISRELGRDA